jgi:hypothetical protein
MDGEAWGAHASPAAAAQSVWQRALAALRGGAPPPRHWQGNDLAMLNEHLLRDIGLTSRPADPRDSAFGHAPTWSLAPPSWRPRG